MININNIDKIYIMKDFYLYGKRNKIILLLKTICAKIIVVLNFATIPNSEVLFVSS